MLDQIEATILSALQTIFDQFGWAGVFGLMVFENATGITPSEVILAFAGWMLIERHGIAPSFILLGGIYAGLGSAVGASITYWVARIGGRPMIDRFAKFFRLDPSLIAKSEEQMHKWGTGLVLIGRVIPGIRTLVSIPAGLAKIPFSKFFFATFIGAYIWCTLLSLARATYLDTSGCWSVATSSNTCHWWLRLDCSQLARTSSLNIESASLR